MIVGVIGMMGLLALVWNLVYGNYTGAIFWLLVARFAQEHKPSEANDTTAAKK